MENPDLNPEKENRERPLSGAEINSLFADLDEAIEEEIDSLKTDGDFFTEVVRQYLSGSIDLDSPVQTESKIDGLLHNETEGGQITPVTYEFDSIIDYVSQTKEAGTPDLFARILKDAQLDTEHFWHEFYNHEGKE